ncbi:MAG: type VI secretion system membrane subunit TssM [Methyloprofundus sp.]|nr:type VI secretion system membrane subunit TssM [Methyloprofundus sp.]
MTKLVDFFKKRWVISLLGILALGLFIWFIGPLFAFAEYAPLESELNRWLLFAALLLLWLLKVAWSYFKAKKENFQMMLAMAAENKSDSSEEQQASDEEVQLLQERLSEALGVLKETRLGSGPDKQFLYQLPWYIIIGPPGAGKTSLLKNSDLKFPLSDSYGKDAVRGVGGTRNCDWWFTEDAVLLDTAGRYTTQDSNETVDQAAWLGFLDLLKKNRSRRPINGVIIAVSIADLLGQSNEQSLAQARAIRQRIQELYERFSIHFPVYLLFTKCDLLAGFMEYFDELDRDRRAQVWGMTFDLEDSEQEKRNNTEQFNQEFELLQQQLQQQLLARLERERGAERRNQIYTFPQQFGSLKELISPFIEEVFQSSRYANDVMFRGVYFTSATQEGSPIDRIMGAMASNFGLESQSNVMPEGVGKSFFINRLLGKVVFAESGLAGTNLKKEKQRSWFQRGAFIGVAALTAVMAGVWASSYFANQAYIKEIETQTAEIQAKIDKVDPNGTNVLPILPLLDQLRNIPGGYADQQAEKSHWSQAFGLYQGDKLGDASVSLYHRLLKNIYLPRLMSRIETQLQNNADNTDYLYEALKAYLMLADPEHYDADAEQAWYNLDWKYNLPADVTTAQRQAMITHLHSLLASRPAPLPRPLNAELIAQTRELLQETPLANRVYARLKLELLKNDESAFSISDKAGRNAPMVLTRKSGLALSSGIPSLFTCKGYSLELLPNSERIISQQAGNNWVLGGGEELSLSVKQMAQLREDVLKLYFQDYISHWEELLADVQIKSVSSQAQLVEMLNIISDKDSPIKLFYEAAGKETNLTCLLKIEQTIGQKIEQKASSVKSSLESIMRTSIPEVSVSVRSGVSPNMVREHFKNFNDFVITKDGVPPALDRTLANLNELHVYLNSLLHASGDELVLEQRKEIMSVISKVTLDGKRAPAPVAEMVKGITDSSRNLVSGGVRNHLNLMWKSDVLPFCQQAIGGLYPIAQSSREITFEDFTHFFGHGGLMDEYFKKYLLKSVEKGRKGWRWNARAGGGEAVSRRALKQFQRADKIKNIFFRMGKQSPKISFKLKPISMNPSISQFIMDIDGQVLKYAHGPIRPVPMKWPGPNNSGQVRIQLVPPIQGSRSGLSKEGPWALFRLFDQADIRPTSNPAVFIMTFNIQGREAKFELRANSAVNPFQLNDLRSFKCLPNL